MAVGFYREVARRVFAQELRDSNLASKDESDQYAPQYILTPTGAKVNRIFFVGTLIEKEDIGTGSEYWRGKGFRSDRYFHNLCWTVPSRSSSVPF